jgi:hypothetical protein
MGKKSKRKTIWRVWAKALGEKGSKCDKEADIIAGVRTFIFFTYLITNIAIVANAIRHWNDNDNNRNSQQISRNYSRHLAKFV